MSLTVRQLMEEQAAGLVGREDERAVLHQLLGEGGPLVVFVHGIAGVGKSDARRSLRGRGARPRARPSSASTAARSSRPSADSSRRSRARPAATCSTPEDAAARLASLGDRVILVLDTYEVLPPVRPVAAPDVRAGPRPTTCGSSSPVARLR